MSFLGEGSGHLAEKLFVIIFLGFYLALLPFLIETPQLEVRVRGASDRFDLKASWDDGDFYSLVASSPPRLWTLGIETTGEKSPDSSSGEVCVGPLAKIVPKEHSLTILPNTTRGQWRSQADGSWCSDGKPGEALEWTVFEEGRLKLPLLLRPDAGIVRLNWKSHSERINLFSSEKKLTVRQFSLLPEEALFRTESQWFYSSARLSLVEGEGRIVQVALRSYGQVLFERNVEQSLTTGEELELPTFSSSETLFIVYGRAFTRWWFPVGLLTFLAFALSLKRFVFSRSADGDDDVLHFSSVVLFLGTSIVSILYFALHPYAIGSWDGYNYAELARGVLNGGVMYRDIWQDKPPLVPLLYLPAALLRFPWGLNLQFACVLILNSWLIYRFLGFLTVTSVARMLAAVSYFWISLFYLSEGNFLGLEHLSNCFVLSVLNIVARNPESRVRWLIAGGIAAALVYIRQNNVFLVVALGFPLLRASYRSKIGYFVLGGVFGALGILLFCLPFIDFSTFLYVVFQYPRVYASVVPGGATPSMAEYLERFLYPALPYLSLALVSIACRSRIETSASGKGRSEFRSCVFSWPFFLFHSLMVLATVLAPQKLFHHYGIYWVPICALSIAIVGESCLIPGLRFLAARVGFKQVSYLLSAMLIFVVFTVSKNLLIQLSPREERANYASLRRIVSTLQGYLEPGEKMFVYGGRSNGLNQNVLYLASATTPAHANSNYCELRGEFHQALPGEFRNFSQAMEEHPPKVLLYSFPLYEPYCASDPAYRESIRQYFQAHYQALDTIGSYVIGVRKTISSDPKG